MESSDSDPMDVADHIRIFGLSQRDLQRGSRATNVSDLAPRQIAFCISTCHKCVGAADILATGGERVSIAAERNRHYLTLHMVCFLGLQGLSLAACY